MEKERERVDIVNFPACSNKYPLRRPGHRAFATASTQAIDLLVLKSEVKLLMCRIVESIGYGLQ